MVIKNGHCKLTDAKVISNLKLHYTNILYNINNP